MAKPKILINGKEVSNLKDLPPSVQKILSDDNNNGIPDIAENPFAVFGKMGDIKDLVKAMPGLQQGLPQIIQKIQSGETKVSINGKEYNNLNEIPESEKAEIKAQFAQLKHLNKSQADIKASQPGVAQKLAQTPFRQTSEIPVTASPAVQEKQDKNRITLFILALLVLGGYIIFQYFLGA